MDHLDGKETKEAEGADVMSLRKVTRKRQTRGKAIREYRRKKQHEKATEKFGRTIPRLHGYDVTQDKEKNVVQAGHVFQNKRDFMPQTNRRSWQESNFHCGNVGNLEIDIGEIRRIVTGSSKSFERENIKRWLPEKRAIKVVCENLILGRRREISENKANLMREYLLSWRERQQRESGLRGGNGERSEWDNTMRENVRRALRDDAADPLFSTRGVMKAE
ncbi:hypothetical protein G5I_12982 [Acromyrmex echinatior]|uniref:Uncharacterized protein n=1 Tax=Acromyrmex echinatior TaxID=103372 RepID=F4X3R9_ACREC|nr:hypothetical protein G5I_12982 [Acromyrmex echinatior]